MLVAAAVVVSGLLSAPLAQGSILEVPKNALVKTDVKVGEGDEAKFMDLVEVHYTGTLLNGKKFDSSLDRGTPFSFQLGLGSVIKGWDNGVPGMRVGGERELIIGSDNAYGERGAGEDIPPNTALKFKVNLMRVIPPAKVEVVTAGEGEGLKMGQALTCSLSMKMEDGPELADPAKDTVLAMSGRMLAGINQSIFGIKKGETRRVTIGSDLMFGKRGLPPVDQPNQKAGSLVGPGKTLIAVITAKEIK